MFVQTAQQWFDGAWERAKDRRISRGVPTPGCPQKCSYPAIGTLPGCFIGCQLPPELALSLDEENNDAAILHADGILGVDRFPVTKESRDAGEFLASLQQIHDLSSPDRWEGELREFAKQHGLTVPGVP